MLLSVICACGLMLADSAFLTAAAAAIGLPAAAAIGLPAAAAIGGGNTLTIKPIKSKTRAERVFLI